MAGGLGFIYSYIVRDMYVVGTICSEVVTRLADARCNQVGQRPPSVFAWLRPSVESSEAMEVLRCPKGITLFHVRTLQAWISVRRVLTPMVAFRVHFVSRV